MGLATFMAWVREADIPEETEKDDSEWWEKNQVNSLVEAKGRWERLTNPVLPREDVRPVWGGVHRIGKYKAFGNLLCQHKARPSTKMVLLNLHCYLRGPILPTVSESRSLLE